MEERALAGLRKIEKRVEKILRIVVTVVSTSGLNWVSVKYTKLPPTAEHSE